MEREIDAKIDKLVELKRQIDGVIAQVGNPNFQLILSCRYIHNMSWDRISDRLGVGNATVRRWHDAALQQVIIPKNFIAI